jgi:NAD(P)-dependent dehydrogenase (short-subunit alcohol dehydrogenase family)
MSGPVVVITGATRGIGAAAAVELARRGAEVAIVGRESARVHATAMEARAAAGRGGAPVHEHVADLLRMDEVRRLGAELLDAHPRIDVLANNAGAMFTSRQETSDGFERTFALNHAAGFLLTELLAERLAESGDGRVVNTASDAHSAADLDLDDLQFAGRRFAAMKVYGTTKLMNILHVRELPRRHPELTAACFHPGVVRTGFGKNDGILYKIGLTAIGPFLRTPAKGARSLVWLALDADPAVVNGTYVLNEKVATPKANAQDDVLAEALWERTSELLGALHR